MNELPEDVFLNVLSYLAIHELLIAEGVCKKWREIILRYWKSIKKITIAEFMDIRYVPSCEVQYYAPQYPALRISEKVISALATRCGKNLRHLESGCASKMELNCLNILATEFPRLQCLDLSKMTPIFPDDDYEVAQFDTGSVFGELRTIRMDACFDDSALAYHNFETVDQLLFKFFSAVPNIESASLAQNTLINGSCLLGLSASIRSLDLGFCRRTTAETLMLVFSSLPNLTHVSLYSNNSLMGNCLLHLPTSLESIDLSYCDSFDVDAMTEFFFGHRRLRSVQLAHVRGLTNRVLSALTEYETDLENLNLSWYLRITYYEGHVHPHDIVQGVKMLGTMKNLKQLDLSRNDFVLDASLITISYGCAKLEDLNVSQLENVTVLGFCSLGRLGNLKKLDISDNDCVDEGVLLSVAHGGKLEFVNARKCKKIGEATVKRLGEFWPNKGTIFQVF